MKKGKRKKHKQDHRPILFPTAAFNKLLKLPVPHNSNCPLMYLFWMKECIRQKTNRIWCTDSYTAGKIGRDGERKGLKWAIGRVKRTKAKLIKMGYGRIIQRRDAAGHFTKSYIEVRFYATKMKIEKEKYLRVLDKDVEEFVDWVNTFTSELMKKEIEIAELKQQLAGGTKKTPTASRTVGTINGTPVNGTGSAYSKEEEMLIESKVAIGNDNNAPTLRVSNGIDDKNKRFYNKCSIKLITAVQAKRKIMREPNLKKWNAQFKNLHIVDKVKKKYIAQVLNWYTANIGEYRVPQAYSAKSFRNKFEDIVNALERSEGGRRKRGKVVEKEWTGEDGEKVGSTQVYLPDYDE